MDANEAAAQLGVSPRRVRALAASGRIDAVRNGKSWEVHALPPRARRRPLAPTSRDLLDQALTQRTLGDMKGQARKRTAERIRELRTAEDPAAIIAAWWGGQKPQGYGVGADLARHALDGDTAYVRRIVRAKRPEFARDPKVLAEIVATERTIAGLTTDRLAEEAGVPAASVKAIEHGRMPDRVSHVLKVLSKLGVEATALPSVES